LSRALRLVVVAAGITATSGVAAQASPATVLSTVGRVSVDGAAVHAGIDLERGALVETHAGAAAQLLIGWRVALALSGRAQIRVLTAAATVQIISARGVVRVSGADVSMSFGRWALRLGTSGTALVDDGRLFVLAGRVVLTEQGSGVRELSLRAGQSVSLTAVGEPAVTDAAPGAGALGRSRVYQPPAPWEPAGLTTDSLRAIQTARGQMQKEQQRQRELASCGCTEGSGPGGGQEVGGADRGPSIENRTGGLRLRITGLPRKTK